MMTVVFCHKPQCHHVFQQQIMKVILKFALSQSAFFSLFTVSQSASFLHLYTVILLVSISDIRRKKKKQIWFTQVMKNLQSLTEHLSFIFTLLCCQSQHESHVQKQIWKKVDLLQVVQHDLSSDPKIDVLSLLVL